MEYHLIKRIHWTSELVNKFWNGVAQSELDDLSFGKVAGPKLLDLISKYLVPDGTHLDFGAGSGYLLQILLERGLSAAGFDPSPERQALLLAKIGKHKNFLGVKGINSAEQFDVVFLMEVVEHVLDEDFDAVIESVVSFVKPGGYLIASTPNNENLEYSSVYCPVSEILFHPWQHVRSFTPAQFSDCFKKRGFSPEFVVLADFSSDAEFVEACKKGAAVESLKKLKATSLRQLSDSIELTVKKYQQQFKELEAMNTLLHANATLGFWQKIKLRLDLLLHHRTLITRLHSISQNMVHCFDEVSGPTLEHLRYAMALKPTDVDRSTQRVDGIDLRIGKETTIVYVGKKQ